MVEEGLTMFLRNNNLCWARIGNEDPEDCEPFVAFEESLFYYYPKKLWNINVPWKFNIWDGGVLLIVSSYSKETLLKDLVEQYKRFQSIKSRCLFKQVCENYRVRLYCLDSHPYIHPVMRRALRYLRFIRTYEMLDDAQLVEEELKFPYDKTLPSDVREVMRQYYLMRKTTLEDCVFYLVNFKGKTSDPIERITYDTGYRSGMFLRIARPALQKVEES